MEWKNSSWILTVVIIASADHRHLLDPAIISWADLQFSWNNLEIDCNPLISPFSSINKSFKLTNFDEGSFVIKPQQILFNGKKYLTDSILIDVRTIKVDTVSKKFFDIKEIILNNEQRIPFSKYLLSFLTTLGVALLLVIQPDLGQTLLVFFSWSILIFISGINIIFLSVMFLSLILIFLYLVFFVIKFVYI